MGETRNGQKLQGAGRRALLIGIVVGAIGGGVGGYLVMDDEFGRSLSTRFERAASPSNDAEASTLEQLQIMLAAEVQARSELADRLAKLDEKVSLLRDIRDDDVARQRAQSNVSAEDPNPDKAGGETQPDDSALAETSSFDDEALLSSGMHPSEVERLRDLWESHALERATINNRALREGWFFQAPHRAEIARLDRELREELQDEDYDRYLYARGQPNRIRAGDVLRGSSASRAGIQSGDIILRYDDVRIFDPGALLRASSAGELGERVAVTVDRNGLRQTVYIERGPLGVILQHRHGPPLSD
jgi:hypothetical protein